MHCLQFEIRDREKRKRDDEERRRAEEIAKKSPPKSPDERDAGSRSPEQTSRDTSVHSPPSAGIVI